MHIKEIPILAFRGGTKQLRIPIYHLGMWHYKTEDENIPVATEYHDLVLAPRTDPSGEPCFAAYDDASDTLYVCYDR